MLNHGGLITSAPCLLKSKARGKQDARQSSATISSSAVTFPFSLRGTFSLFVYAFKIFFFSLCLTQELLKHSIKVTLLAEGWFVVTETTWATPLLVLSSLFLSK